MEMKLGSLETSQNVIEKKVQDFQNKVDKKVEVSAFNDEIKAINFNLRKVQLHNKFCSSNYKSCWHPIYVKVVTEQTLGESNRAATTKSGDAARP